MNTNSTGGDFSQTIFGTLQYSFNLAQSNLIYFVTPNYTEWEPNGPVLGNSSVPANEWHHVSVTYDGSDLIYYLDGELDHSESINYQLNQVSINDFYIG